MSRIDVRSIDSLPMERWRNGGGLTRPISSSGSDWRISLAEVEHNGPYSRFEGIDRVSLVLTGAGVMLRGTSSVVALRPFEAVEYDGGMDWNATLIAGPVTALNVTTSRGRCRASVRAIAEPLIVKPGCPVVVVALTVGCAWSAADSESSCNLEAGQFLIAERLEHAIHLSPIAPATNEGESQALSALVTIEPVARTSD